MKQQTVRVVRTKKSTPFVRVKKRLRTKKGERARYGNSLAEKRGRLSKNVGATRQHKYAQNSNTILMRKVCDKIALVTQTVIASIFVLTALLALFGRIRIFTAEGVLAAEPLLLVLLIILAAAFVALSVFLFVRQLSNMALLNDIMLGGDSKSATKISAKALARIVRKCCARTKEIRVKKIKLMLQPNNSLSLKIFVKIRGELKSIDRLRFLLQESFFKTMGLTFDLIEFQILRFESGFTPNEEKATDNAETLSAQRKFSADCFENPILDENVKDDGKEKVNVSELLQPKESKTTDVAVTTQKNTDERKKEERTDLFTEKEKNSEKEEEATASQENATNETVSAKKAKKATDKDAKGKGG